MSTTPFRQAHPMTDDDPQPERTYEWMVSARSAVAHALWRAGCATGVKPTPGMVAYFRDAVLEEQDLHNETIARLDRILSTLPPPDAVPRITRVAGPQSEALREASSAPWAESELSTR